MSKEELIQKLKQCAEDPDTEAAHCAADSALLEYIDDAEITAAYDSFEKWYG